MCTRSIQRMIEIANANLMKGIIIVKFNEMKDMHNI